MPGAVARLVSKFAIHDHDGPIGPWESSFARAVTKWTGKISIPIATGVSAQGIAAIDAQGITTVTMFKITSDKDISVAYNGGTALALGAGGEHNFAGVAFTAITITNASGSTAQVTYEAAGT